jgi:pimeloyl-ACP methyl ester carboxylesterase
MAGFADDIAWQCAELGLHRPVVIGHSLGGAISLDLCAPSGAGIGRRAELPRGVAR